MRLLRHALAVQANRSARSARADSQRLAAVAVEGEAGLRIDYCESCRGYLKTYDGQGDEALLLADWTSLHLDLVAPDRGLKRLAASLYEFAPAATESRRRARSPRGLEDALLAKLFEDRPPEQDDRRDQQRRAEEHEGREDVRRLLDEERGAEDQGDGREDDREPDTPGAALRESGRVAPSVFIARPACPAPLVLVGLVGRAVAVEAGVGSGHELVHLFLFVLGQEIRRAGMAREAPAVRVRDG